MPKESATFQKKPEAAEGRHSSARDQHGMKVQEKVKSSSPPAEMRNTMQKSVIDSLTFEMLNPVVLINKDQQREMKIKEEIKYAQQVQMSRTFK